MLRLNVFRSPALLALTVAAFTLIMLPLDGLAKDARPAGAIVGFVYGSDMKTPVEGAVVKVRNLENGQEFVSTPTDDNGSYAIEGVEEGRYTLGVTASEGDYNFDYAVEVKGGEIGKLSLALKTGNAAPLGQQASGSSGNKPSFFYTPVGVAVLMVATTMALYGLFKLVEEEEEASPSSIR